MALQKQTVVLAAGSMTTGRDPKQAPLGSFARIENAHRGRSGEYVKRGGVNEFSKTSFPSAIAVRDVWQLATYRGALVRLSTQGQYPLFVYSPTKGQWSRTEPPSYSADATVLRSEQRGAVTTRRYPILPSVSSASTPDIAVSGNYACMVYRDVASPRNKIVVLDMAAGTRVMTAPAAGNEGAPMVITSGGYFCIVTRTGAGDVKIDRIEIATIGSGTGLPTTFTHVTGAVTPLIHQAIDFGGILTIALNLGGGAGTRIVEFDPAAGTFAATNHAALDANLSIGWLSDFGGGGKRYLATAGSTNGLQVHVVEATRAVSATYTMDAGATASVLNLVGHTINNTAAGHFNLLYDITNATGHLDRTKFAQRTGAGISNGEWLRSVSIRSKTFQQGSDYFFVGAYDSSAQATYFLFRVPTDVLSTTPPARAVLAQYLPWQGNGRTELNAAPTSVVSLASGRWLFSVVRRTRVLSFSTGIFFDLGIDVLEAGFDQVMSRPADAAGLLAVPGGATPYFDGASFGESGFPVYPEQPALTPSAAGGSMTAGGTYQYVVVERYEDATGRVHRSAPSIPKQVTLGGGDNRCSVVQPNLRIGSRANAGNVVHELYRNVNGGTLFHKIADLTNSVTADTAATYDDQLSDADLSSGELLYTTGGVLENHPWPATVAVVEYRQRLFMIPSEARDHVRCTKPFAPGVGPAVNETLDISVADEYGDLTALAVMDDKLVLFKRNAIYVLSGDGPDNLGRGGYQAPTRIAVGDGTSNPQSVVVCPLGVMFQHVSKGFRLLTRGLGVEDVGEPVDLYDATACTGAVHVEHLDQVRFYESASGLTRVYDYRHKEWVFYNSQNAVSATLYDAVPVYAAPTGQSVYRETPNAFSHAGADISMQFRTTSIALAGLAGYQRIYEIQLTGEFVGAHRLLVQIFYDHDYGVVSSPEEKLLTVSAAPWEIAIRPARQRCSSIQLVIYDIYDDDLALTNVAGFKLSAITAQVGVIPGLNRLAASKRMPPAP